MRQSPVYVLNHSQHNFRQRTSQVDLDEIRGSAEIPLAAFTTPSNSGRIMFGKHLS